MNKGVVVIGASSMGALRAAELEQFGMQGFGKIFNAYKNLEIDGDDEVSISHSEDFKHQSIPLINLRFSLNQAIKKNIISKENANKVITETKNKPYYERSLNCVKNKKLKTWLQTNYIDQKNLDSIGLLENINENDIKKLEPPKTSKSIFFDKIQIEMQTEPFDEPYSWLPKDELKLIELAKSKHFKQFKRLKKLEMLKLKSHNNSDIQQKIFKFLIIDAEATNSIHLNHKLKECLKKNSIEIANLISGIQKNQLLIEPKHIQDYADNFRRERNLLSHNSTKDWMDKHGLTTTAEFSEYISYMAYIHYFIDDNNLAVMNQTTNNFF
jgi:hypothetical protein